MKTPALRVGFLLLTGMLLSACNRQDSPSQMEAAGNEKSAKTKTLEVGAAALQSLTPIERINVYLDGFHFHAGQMQNQMEAHHYATIVNEDFIQAVIYDGNGKDAKLVGIEYIISERMFKTLPEEEKALWHSHAYEVKSGQLIAPGLPEVAERELMEKMAGTYGKTWHTWDTSNPTNNLPYGIPMLMMGFTADGQISPELLMKRDQRMKANTGETRKKRAHIPSPHLDPGADAWQKGKIPSLSLDWKEVPEPTGRP